MNQMPDQIDPSVRAMLEQVRLETMRLAAERGDRVGNERRSPYESRPVRNINDFVGMLVHIRLTEIAGWRSTYYGVVVRIGQIDDKGPADAVWAYWRDTYEAAIESWHSATDEALRLATADGGSLSYLQYSDGNYTFAIIENMRTTARRGSAPGVVPWTSALPHADEHLAPTTDITDSTLYRPPAHSFGTIRLCCACQKQCSSANEMFVRGRDGNFHLLYICDECTAKYQAVPALTAAKPESPQAPLPLRKIIIKWRPTDGKKRKRR